MKSPIPLTATIIGAPKIEDFAPLTPQEMGQIAGPIQQALSQGMDSNQPAAIPTMVLCRLLNTVNQSFQEWRVMCDLLSKLSVKLLIDSNTDDLPMIHPAQVGQFDIVLTKVEYDSLVAHLESHCPNWKEEYLDRIAPDDLNHE